MSPLRPTVVAPLPRKPHPAPRPPYNGGNTCYIDAVLVALFAEFDAWDGLLQSDCPTALVSQLAAIVNNLRVARQVSAHAMNDLRAALVSHARWYSGRGQHDAAELFACLLDALQAPFVPLVKNLAHGAAPDDDADHVPFTERLLWLNVCDAAPDHALARMVDAYFYGEVVHGLRRRGAPAPLGVVDAHVSRSLIPSYTPVRETGETVSASRHRFLFLTVPFGVARFSPTGDRKTRTAIAIPTALPATRYVEPFANGVQHTLMLRSVVCHLGLTLRSGHYVAYTYGPAVGWRRWDDLEDGAVRSVRGNVHTGLPEDAGWTAEIMRDSYIIIYELVPGDADIASAHKLMASDASLAAQAQVEEDGRAAWEMNRQMFAVDDGHGISFVTMEEVEERMVRRGRERDGCASERVPQILSAARRAITKSESGSLDGWQGWGECRERESKEENGWLLGEHSKRR